MNKNFKAGKQGGFTLIELIVVIVILGILAATALPKFADLGGDARRASLKGAKGAIASASAMVHAQSLIANQPSGSVTIEGVTVNLVHGYPSNGGQLAQAAGLSTDGITSDDYVMTTTAGLVISPKGATTAANCSVTYTAPTAANTAPTIVEVATGC